MSITFVCVPCDPRMMNFFLPMNQRQIKFIYFMKKKWEWCHIMKASDQHQSSSDSSGIRLIRSRRTWIKKNISNWLRDDEDNFKRFFSLASYDMFSFITAAKRPLNCRHSKKKLIRAKEADTFNKIYHNPLTWLDVFSLYKFD